MTQGAFCQESFSCECDPGISSFCDGREVHFLVSSPLNWGRWPVHCDQHCLVISRCTRCLHRLLGRILYQLRLWDIHCPSGVATPRPPVLTALPLSLRLHPVSAGAVGGLLGRPPQLVPPGDSWLSGYYQQGPLTS